MTEEKNPLATALGVYYPTHFVVAAFDDPASATGALAALRAAGFADAAVELCPGPRFLENYYDFVANRGLLERAAGLLPSEEPAAAEYVAEAERGASFVSVHAPQRAERERARAAWRPTAATACATTGTTPSPTSIRTGGMGDARRAPGSPSPRAGAGDPRPAQHRREACVEVLLADRSMDATAGRVVDRGSSAKGPATPPSHR